MGLKIFTTPPLAGTADSGNAFLYAISGGWSDLLLNFESSFPTAQAEANFGNAVAITATHALIGAQNYNSSSSVTSSGNAYLYSISNGTWTNLLGTTGAPDAQADAKFGSAVALSATHALIGAEDFHYSSTADSGNAFLYTINGGSWLDLRGTTGAPTAQADANFGSAVALSATHALIGARGYDATDTTDSLTGHGSAHLYTIGTTDATAWLDLTGTTGAPTAQAGANFGSAVALSATHALIGARGYDATDTTDSLTGHGSAHLYTIGTTDATAWLDLTGTTGAPTAQAGANFGSAVALSATRALIGARGYDATDTTDSLTGHGSAHLYTIGTTDATAWLDLMGTTDAPTAQASANFGSAVALSATHALIGASGHDANTVSTDSFTGHGNAYLYTFSGTTWTDLYANSNAPTEQDGANFGASVALSSSHVVVGAPMYNYPTTPVSTASGNAFLLTLAPSATTPAFDSVVTPASILTMLAGTPAMNGMDAIPGTNVAYTATSSIYVYSSIDLSGYTPSDPNNPNTLTLTPLPLTFS